MNMKKLFTREILIGLLLVFGLAVLFLGIDFLKGENVFKSTNIYYVNFKDVSGLSEAAPVTLNGMKVGQITGIEYDYDHPGTVVVEVNMDKNIKLTKGSKFIKNVGLLGSAELQLMMAVGDNFVEEETFFEGEASADMLAGLATDVLPQVVEMLPKINSILNNIDSITNSPALYASVERLDAISQNLEVLSNRLAEASNQVSPVLGNVQTITDDLASVSSDLKTISAELKQLPLAETMNNVKATTDNLNDFTLQLKSKDSSLGLLLNDRGLYDHIDHTICSLDSILIDLKAHPKKYVQFKLL